MPDHFCNFYLFLFGEALSCQRFWFYSIQHLVTNSNSIYCTLGHRGVPNVGHTVTVIESPLILNWNELISSLRVYSHRTHSDVSQPHVFSPRWGEIRWFIWVYSASGIHSICFVHTLDGRTSNSQIDEFHTKLQWFVRFRPETAFQCIYRFQNCLVTLWTRILACTHTHTPSFIR